MSRVGTENIDVLTAGITASMHRMSSYAVNALGSFEWVLLVDTRRLLNSSQLA